MLSIAFANVLDPMGTFVFVATWINPERFATEVGLSLAVPLLLSSLMYKKIVPSITKLLGFDITKTTIAIWLAMSPTCRRHVGPTAKCRHFLPTQPCHADTKLIPTQHFLVRDGQHLPFFFLYQSTYTQPAKNLYSTYVVLSKI
jgi:hypothetical protein